MRAFFPLFLILLFSNGIFGDEPIICHLAKDGKALLKITVSEKASQKTLALAEELAEYLSNISGATFETASGGEITL